MCMRSIAFSVDAQRFCTVKIPVYVQILCVVLRESGGEAVNIKVLHDI